MYKKIRLIQIHSKILLFQIIFNYLNKFVLSSENVKHFEVFEPYCHQR
jgi:hypothetical protein